MTNMGRRCVEHEEITMHLMSSGSAVTSVRSGSMASVLRLPQRRLSILSITSVHPAATKELVLHSNWGRWTLKSCSSSLVGFY